jgi:hypothetical protein
MHCQIKRISHLFTPSVPIVGSRIDPDWVCRSQCYTVAPQAFNIFC